MIITLAMGSNIANHWYKMSNVAIHLVVITNCQEHLHSKQFV